MTQQDLVLAPGLLYRPANASSSVANNIAALQLPVIPIYCSGWHLALHPD
ncbi:hypothetical protein [Undibacterium sp. Ren11W]